MFDLIDYITGRPIEVQDLESIQTAIEVLQANLSEALRIRDVLKEKGGTQA